MADEVVVEIGFEESEIMQEPETTKKESGKSIFQGQESNIPFTSSLTHHCFACLEQHSSTYFNIKNRKCKLENLHFKLQTFLGEIELVDKLYDCKEAAICRSCYRKINFVHTFHKNLKMGIKAYVASCGSDSQSNKNPSTHGPKRPRLVVNIQSTTITTPKTLTKQTVRHPQDFPEAGRQTASTASELSVSDEEMPGPAGNEDLPTNESRMKEVYGSDRSCHPIANLHILPSEDHAYTMSSGKKLPVEGETETTESDCDGDDEDQSESALGERSIAHFRKIQFQNHGNCQQCPIAIKETRDLAASIETHPYISLIDDVADVKKEIMKIVPISGNAPLMKESKKTDAKNCNEEKNLKKQHVPTPFRHYDSVKSFGKLTVVDKGSPVLDITKSKLPYGHSAQGKLKPKAETVKEMLTRQATPSAPYIAMVHNYAIEEETPPNSQQPVIGDNLSEEEFYAALEMAVQKRDMYEIVNTLTLHKDYKERVKGLYIQTVQWECQELCLTKQVAGQEDPSSVLRKVNSLAALCSYKDYVAEIFSEMRKRCPLLLDVLVAVTGSHPTSLPVENIGPITSVYAILMKTRNPAMTGWHKLISCVLEHGFLEERMLVVLNHIGIAPGSTSRARMLEKVADDKEENLAKLIRQFPYAKITCDIGVRSGGPNLTENENSDIQLLAATLVLVKDIDASLDNTPLPFPDKVPSTTFLPTPESLDKLQSAYAVLVGRIIKDLPGLSWLTVPKHILHSRSAFASRKTEIHPLPMAFCYETKRNDGVKVLQSLQDSLLQLYNKGNGDGLEVDRAPVPIGADQMSRAQLEFARTRKIAKVPQKDRFKHLGPFVTEFWHNKKDFVVKAYQALFSKKSLYQHGTLYYFKSKFQLAFVTGNVEKNLAAHYDLLLYLGKCLIRELAMEYFCIDSEDGDATKNLPENVEDMSEEEKLKVSEEVLKKFIQHFGYGSLVFSDCRPQTKTYEVKSVLPDGRRVLVEVPEEHEGTDEVYNYCMQLTHWVLHLMEMEDTAREGDADRLVLDTQYNLPFFYSFSPYSNQLSENIDFLIKIKHTLSPLMRELIMRTAFVNFEGGEGKCCEADYAHDQCVRNQKSLVRHLDTIATDRMVRYSSGAADVVCQITDNAAHSLRILKKKTKASKHLTEGQKDAIRSMLRSLRPFKKVPGRRCAGFRDIEAYPFAKASRTEMFKCLDGVVGRLRRGEGLEFLEVDAMDIEQTLEPPVKRKRRKKTSKHPVEPADAVNPENIYLSKEKPGEPVDTMTVDVNPSDISSILDLLGDQ